MEISKIKKIKKIDLNNFEILFRNYYSELCQFAVKYTKDSDVAEEIVQDFFYNIWKKRKTLTIKSSLKSYLYRAVRNNCLLHLQHQTVKRKHQEYVKQSNNFQIGNPYDELIFNETYELFDKTLNLLPERCKEIFKLSRFEGLKYREIAEKMSISIKTVEANMGKALKQFRLSFQDYAYIICFILTII